jgi:hypothetical protein
MRALVVDEEAREAIARVRTHAEANVVSRRTVLALVEGLGEPAGDDPAFCCSIHDGFRVVFSIEDQPAGMVRHLSISIPDGKGKCPSPEAVQIIGNEFGFEGSILQWSIWLEEEGIIAVNAAQVIGD